jgi:A118 family predicted phage portal protein
VWEFESGERALYADTSAFEKDSDGNAVLPQNKRRLYRTLNQMDAAQLGEPGFFQEWSPEFREAAIKAGLNDVLRQIEFACGMSYGVLSDPQVQALTATEVKTTQQRFYSTVSDTQKALEHAFNGLLYAMDTYATIYGLAPRGNYVADYEFDDSIIVDDAIQAATDKTAVDMGAMSKLEWRMKTYGETKEVAQERLAEAQAEQAKAAADQLAARVNAVRAGIGQNQPGQVISQ